MHSAPAVDFPAGRSRFQGWLISLVGSAGCLADVLWCYQVESIGWRQGLLLATLFATFVLALWAWRHCPSGRLRWDGQAWNWSGAAGSVAGVLAVHLDLQSCLILSLRPAGAARIWLWPQRQTDAGSWDALRCAVFAHPSVGQTRGTDVDSPGAQPPVGP